MLWPGSVGTTNRKRPARNTADIPWSATCSQSIINCFELKKGTQKNCETSWPCDLIWCKSSQLLSRLCLQAASDEACLMPLRQTWQSQQHPAVSSCWRNLKHSFMNAQLPLTSDKIPLGSFVEDFLFLHTSDCLQFSSSCLIVGNMPAAKCCIASSMSSLVFFCNIPFWNQCDWET